VQTLRVERNEERIDLPATTRRNLELTQTLRGEDSPTLFSLMDTCMTGMGSRTLKRWLLEPPRERTLAQQRLDAIASLQGEHGAGVWRDVRTALKGLGDVQRISARIALRQVRPRELVALGNALQRAAQLPELLLPSADTPWLKTLCNALIAPPECAELLRRALLPEPSAMVRDGA
jgi:DNA mismatch repair protein MutS